MSDDEQRDQVHVETHGDTEVSIDNPDDAPRTPEEGQDQQDQQDQNNA